MQKYYKPLKSQEKSSAIVQSVLVDDIFFQIPQILAHHESFLKELKIRLESWDPKQTIGDWFLESVSLSFENRGLLAYNDTLGTRKKCHSIRRFLVRGYLNLYQKTVTASGVTVSEQIRIQKVFVVVYRAPLIGGPQVA